MPKYLLLKHYRGGPEPHRPVPPMDQWDPVDVEAHMAFLRHVAELLEKNGELVDAQALTPARTWVRYGGPDAAPVTTDGPLPETSDLVAGWYMIDVDSHERAVELAAYVSSEPGPGGEPMYEWIDVREVMSEARGLLALMLLNHARLPARLDTEGRIVTLDRQDRGLWDAREIAEGVRVLQSALALQSEDRRPGRYQVEAAIAALHDDAAGADETDWPQILAWYDDLVALTDDPVHRDPAAVLGRAVAAGHVLGAAAGLRETDRLREVIGDRHRWHAVRGHLHELDRDAPAAAAADAEAARRATTVAERDHLVRQAARARALPSSS